MRRRPSSSTTRGTGSSVRAHATSSTCPPSTPFRSRTVRRSPSAPGSTPGRSFIDGARNVTITGKVDPALGPPRSSRSGRPTASAPSCRTLISVKNSTNVTISNLSLDGAPKGSTTTNWNPAVVDVNGIHVVNSSVTHQRQHDLAHPPADTEHAGRHAPSGSTAPHQGTLSRSRSPNNTLFDFNESGVRVEGLRKPGIRRIITGNVIWNAFNGTTTAGSPSGDFGHGHGLRQHHLRHLELRGFPQLRPLRARHRAGRDPAREGEQQRHQQRLRGHPRRHDRRPGRDRQHDQREHADRRPDRGSSCSPAGR